MKPILEELHVGNINSHCRGHHLQSLETCPALLFHSAGISLPDWLSLQIYIRVVKSEEF